MTDSLDIYFETTLEYSDIGSKLISAALSFKSLIDDLNCFHSEISQFKAFTTVNVLLFMVNLD